MDEYELKVCPFCASGHVDIEQNWAYGGASSDITVICRSCGARSKSIRVNYGQDPEPALREVTEAWNTRRRKPKADENDSITQT